MMRGCFKHHNKDEFMISHIIDNLKEQSYT
jgi:hypothetical protein